MISDGYDDPPQPADGVYSVELDGELVLYHATLNRAVRLDPQATLIWQVIDGSVSVDELVSDLTEVFDVESSRVRADLEDMLGDLFRLGFLRPTVAAQPSDGPDAVLPDPPSP